MIQADPAMESEGKQAFVEKEQEMLKGLGGVSCWKELPEDERLRLMRELIWDAEICLGERIPERLPAEERREC